MGAFDENGAQDRVSPPYPSAAALAGTLVVPGTDPRPGGAVPGGCEDRHVGAQFDEDRHGGFAADAGQGLEKPDLGLVGSEGGVAVEPGREIAQDPPAMCVEFDTQGIAEEAELLADMPAQPAQDVLTRVTGDDALEDAATPAWSSLRRGR